MLHYIHIQGKHAPGFYFKNQHAQDFKNLLDGLSNGSSVVISSKHRTDIIFETEKDALNEVFKLWSLFLHDPIEDSDKRKLTVRIGREAILDQFFGSLVALSKMNPWYQSFLEEFRLACELERTNKILLDLLACEHYLQRNKKTIKRPQMMLRPFIRSSKSLWSQLAINFKPGSLN